MNVDTGSNANIYIYIYIDLRIDIDIDIDIDILQINIIPAQTPNSLGRNTWAEKLYALHLSNGTARYLVLVAANMTRYQHFISKISVVHACFEKETL